MKATTVASTLMAEANASEHREAYRTNEKAANYRLGAGVRLSPPNPPYFFVEILIYLTRDNDKVDLTVLEKSTSALRELQSRKFAAVFQDGNSISCEKQVPPERLSKECELNNALLKRIFDTCKPRNANIR